MASRNVLLIILPLCLLGMLFTSAVHASRDEYKFATEQQRQDFKKLTATLRCPMCQNQNIADSDAMIAHDMRRKVYQLITEGQTSDQVIDFMKTRYGDFVYYQPPVTKTTIWLWLLPIVVLFVGAYLVFTRKPSTPVTQDESAALAKAEALLEEDK
ncbi:cytochrome c-type biogenesis protein [Opacimonas viscosa]|uniref:Cytochrome c-type biogenesis protein n=1 Tax=Opacimonas viscosa TaxID=2961944 RepID=A0AA41WWN9_9ALTE|nr:cytochrome c-type biogenesis protein [Opacimonas viscosa]MCP3427745.1 cytochrome c-type biogenesis protein CcmH [Opacimonas viscosa]